MGQKVTTSLPGVETMKSEEDIENKTGNKRGEKTGKQKSEERKKGNSIFNNYS